MSRTPIETLFNVSMGVRKPFDSELAGIYDESDLIIYDRVGGKILGIISQTWNLFDADGNFFEPSQN